MILDEDIHIIENKDVGDNLGYRFMIKFLSLEGEDICWKKEQAEQLKQEFLYNQAKLQKVWDIINIDTVGWASPKVLIDTLKREVFEK